MVYFVHHFTLLVLIITPLFAQAPKKHSNKNNTCSDSLYNPALGLNSVRRMNIAPRTIDNTRLTNATIVANNIAPGAIGQAQLAPAIQTALAGATANYANTLIKRDANGNFSAGTITANLVGNVTGTIANPQITGNVHIFGNQTTQGNLNTKGNVIIGGCTNISGNLLVDSTITTPTTYNNSIQNKPNIVFIDANGQLGTIVSSRRYKENIQELTHSNVLNKLHPVSFTYKTDITKQKHYGLIAEEVALVAPELVIFNKQNLPETVAYHHLPPLLLSAYQEQNKRIQQLEDQITQIQHMCDTMAMLLYSFEQKKL